MSSMTSMVVSLESIRVFGDVFIKNFSFFNLDQYADFLHGLETLYWHARSFNTDKTIRENLHNVQFMIFPDDSSRLPHLLEQEIYSLSKIIEISFLLLSKGKSIEERRFGALWVHRFIFFENI